MLLILLSGLYSTWLVDPSLSHGFSKDKTTYKVKSRYNQAGVSEKIIDVVKLLVDAGYLDQVKGHHDKTGAGNSFTARIRPSGKLQNEFKTLEADLHAIDHHKFAELIILREKYRDEDDEVQSRSVEYSDTDLTIRWREQLQDYNALLKRTFIDIPTLTDPVVRTIIKNGPRKGQEKIVSIGPDDKHVHRVFNGLEADNFTKGGRFYGGWWLQVPKEYRKLIYLNDKPTVEVDYKALHPNLLMKDPVFDPYDLDEIVLPTVYNDKNDQRSAVKGIVLMAINASSARKAFTAFRESRKEGDRSKRLTNLQLQKLLDAFTDKYPEIKASLNTGHGLTLMNKDSQIANMILDYYTQQGIPVLCVHDSFIIEWDREKDLRRVMDYAPVQVRGKRIAKDSKKNEKIHTLRLWANPPLQSGATTIDISIPAKVERTPQYLERWQKHQKAIKDA